MTKLLSVCYEFDGILGFICIRNRRKIHFHLKIFNVKRIKCTQFRKKINLIIQHISRDQETECAVAVKWLSIIISNM